MQNFGRENFDDSTCIRQNSSDFSTVKILRYTVLHTSSESLGSQYFKFPSLQLSIRMKILSTKGVLIDNCYKKKIRIVQKKHWNCISLNCGVVCVVKVLMYNC